MTSAESEQLIQKNIFSSVEKIYRSGRWPHSTIILGDSGYGSLPLALNIAKIHLCSYTEYGYCNECSDCKRINHIQHPNLSIEIPTYRDTDSDQLMQEWIPLVKNNPFIHAKDFFRSLKQETAKPNITVSNIRKLIHRINTSSLEKKSKIIIIWQADYLGKAGNILLKTIEEPPENTIILILANREEHLLNTITSRSQIFRTKPLTQDEVCSLLKARTNTQDNEYRIRKIALLSEGSMSSALQLLAYQDDTHEKYYIDFLRMSYLGDAYKLKLHVEEGNQQGKNFLIQSFEFGFKFLRAILLFNNHNIGEEIALNKEAKEAAEKLALLINLEKLAALSNMNSQILLGLNRNANTKILLFTTGFEIHLLLKNKQI